MIHHPKLLKDTITHSQEEYKKAQINKKATQLAEAIARSTAVIQPAKQLVADELQKLFKLYQQGGLYQKENVAQKNKLMQM